MGGATGSGGESGAPIAANLSVKTGTEDGQPIVLLIETGQVSQHTTKLSPELAESLAELLSTGARRAELGLVLPPNN